MNFEHFILALLATITISIFTIAFWRSVLLGHVIIFSLTVLIPSTIAYNEFSSLGDSFLAAIFSLIYLPTILLGYAANRLAVSNKYSSLAFQRNISIILLATVFLAAIFFLWFGYYIHESPLYSLARVLFNYGVQEQSSEVLRSNLLKESTKIPFLRSVAVAAWDVLSPAIPISCIYLYKKYHHIKSINQVVLIFASLFLASLGFIISLFFGERYAVIRYLQSFTLVIFFFLCLPAKKEFRLVRLGSLIKKRLLSKLALFSTLIISIILLLPSIHLLTYSQSSLSSSDWLSNYVDNLVNILVDRIGTGQVVELFHRFDYVSRHGLLLGSGIPVPFFHFFHIPPGYIHPNTLIHSEYSASVLSVVGGAPSIWYGDLYLNFGLFAIASVLLFGFFASYIDKILTSICSGASLSTQSLYYVVFLYTSWSLYFSDLSLGFIAVYHDFRFVFLLLYTMFARYVFRVST